MLAATADVICPILPPSRPMQGPTDAGLDSALAIEREDDSDLNGTEAAAADVGRAPTRRERGFGLQSRRQPAWRDRPWDSGCLTFL
jgi:hypothetical protein